MYPNKPDTNINPFFPERPPYNPPERRAHMEGESASAVDHPTQNRSAIQNQYSQKQSLERFVGGSQQDRLVHNTGPTAVDSLTSQSQLPPQNQLSFQQQLSSPYQPYLPRHNIGQSPQHQPIGLNNQYMPATPNRASYSYQPVAELQQVPHNWRSPQYQPNPQYSHNNPWQPTAQSHETSQSHSRSHLQPDSNTRIPEKSPGSSQRSTNAAQALLNLSQTSDENLSALSYSLSRRQSPDMPLESDQHNSITVRIGETSQDTGAVGKYIPTGATLEAETTNEAEVEKIFGISQEQIAASLQRQKDDRERTKRRRLKTHADILRRAEEAEMMEEAKRVEEAKKAEEVKRVEEAMKAEEVKRVEEAKKAEEAKKIEEARKVQEAKELEEAKRIEEAPAQQNSTGTPKKIEEQGFQEVANSYGQNGTTIHPSNKESDARSEKTITKETTEKRTGEEVARKSKPKNIAVKIPPKKAAGVRSFEWPRKKTTSTAQKRKRADLGTDSDEAKRTSQRQSIANSQEAKNEPRRDIINRRRPLTIQAPEKSEDQAVLNSTETIQQQVLTSKENQGKSTITSRHQTIANQLKRDLFQKEAEALQDEIDSIRRRLALLTQMRLNDEAEVAKKEKELSELQEKISTSVDQAMVQVDERPFATRSDGGESRDLTDKSSNPQILIATSSSPNMFVTPGSGEEPGMPSASDRTTLTTPTRSSGKARKGRTGLLGEITDTRNSVDLFSSPPEAAELALEERQTKSQEKDWVRRTTRPIRLRKREGCKPSDDLGVNDDSDSEKSSDDIYGVSPQRKRPKTSSGRSPGKSVNSSNATKSNAQSSSRGTSQRNKVSGTSYHNKVAIARPKGRQQETFLYLSSDSSVDGKAVPLFRTTKVSSSQYLDPNITRGVARIKPHKQFTKVIDNQNPKPRTPGIKEAASALGSKGLMELSSPPNSPKGSRQTQNSKFMRSRKTSGLKGMLSVRD